MSYGGEEYEPWLDEIPTEVKVAMDFIAHMNDRHGGIPSGARTLTPQEARADDAAMKTIADFLSDDPRGDIRPSIN